MTTLVPDSTMFSFMGGGGGGGARLGSMLGGAGVRTSGGFAGATGSTQMLVARGSPTPVAGRGSPQQSQRNQADSVSGMQHEISYAGFSQGMDSSGAFRLLWAIASGQRETETEVIWVVLFIQSFIPPLPSVPPFLPSFFREATVLHPGQGAIRHVAATLFWREQLHAAAPALCGPGLHAAPVRQRQLRAEASPPGRRRLCVQFGGDITVGRDTLPPPPTSPRCCRRPPP